MMRDELAIVMMCVYNLTILAGTAYLVDERGWSPWWFLFAVMMFVYTKEKKETK
jgi:hypothetical protein